MRRTAAASLVTIACVALTGCAGKSEPAASTAPPSPAAVSPTSTGPESAAASPTPTTPAVDQTIHITYAGGKVSGVSSLVKVKLGSTVALVVTSDVADEVHFHGYDKSVDVAKGGTATLTFKATLPGRFEVELEKLKRRLVVLQIQ